MWWSEAADGAGSAGRAVNVCDAVASAFVFTPVMAKSVLNFLDGRVCFYCLSAVVCLCSLSAGACLYGLSGSVCFLLLELS